MLVGALHPTGVASRVLQCTDAHRTCSWPAPLRHVFVFSKLQQMEPGVLSSMGETRGSCKLCGAGGGRPLAAQGAPALEQGGATCTSRGDSQPQCPAHCTGRQ